MREAGVPERLRPVSGESGPADAAVLFVDLVSSTDFAGVMGLQEFADFAETFRSLCDRQCRYFFGDLFRGEYRHDGSDYGFEIAGDELAVFLHSERPHDDVYKLICLALSLKCAWLGTDFNEARVARGLPSAELAAGIHSGRIWTRRRASGLERSGFTISMAKRTESASRLGDHFRVFVSDPAFKLINRKVRNLIFGARQMVLPRSSVAPIGFHELVDSFVDPARRLEPGLAAGFREVARAALRTNTFDLWIHSCLQVVEENDHGRVTPECLSLCQHVLNIDPRNAVALYYAAQAAREADEPETARLFLEDLVRAWPSLGDGWLELGRVQRLLGDKDAARRSILQARRFGVDADEEPLP